MTNHDTGYCMIHPGQRLKRYVGPEGDDVYYQCPICRAQPKVTMKPFGTIQVDHCQYHPESKAILGGDDEWYCENCSPTYFANINSHYNQ